MLVGQRASYLGFLREDKEVGLSAGQLSLKSALTLFAANRNVNADLGFFRVYRILLAFGIDAQETSNLEFFLQFCGNCGKMLQT